MHIQWLPHNTAPFLDDNLRKLLLRPQFWFLFNAVDIWLSCIKIHNFQFFKEIAMKYRIPFGTKFTQDTHPAILIYTLYPC